MLFAVDIIRNGGGGGNGENKDTMFVNNKMK
jgi:hypothetical protein